MQPTFIFGHKKPDTDSVCSAIALSYLKNKLGESTMPRVLGEINSETKFVLKYFNTKIPIYLNDVKLQIKDIEYQKNLYCNYQDSLYNVINYMQNNNISSIPIVNDKKRFMGLLFLKDIIDELIKPNYNKIYTSFDNIINTINGEPLLKFDDEINGDVLVASYRSTTFLQNVNINNDTILIIGDRHSIIEYAIESKAKLVIITGNNFIKPEHIELAKKNKVNIIKTPLRTFNVVKIIGMCNYAETLAKTNDIIIFNEKDYVKDFIDTANRYRYTNYPVINKYKECLGIIKINDTVNKIKKRVILVDHNEFSQSVEGLDEAEIIEIIDHHRLGTIGTNKPINFRNMPVGSTCTILYMIYKENNIDIPNNIAGLLLSGIISDTLLFKSPTTTEIDKKIAIDLAIIADVDMEKYAFEMFKQGSNIQNKTANEILFNDFKTFNVDNDKIGIAQIFLLNNEEIKKKELELLTEIKETANNQKFPIVCLFVTDIIKEGSYIYYNEKAKSVLEKAFDINNITQGHFLPNIVSRKKQIIPNIVEILDDK